jgi:hypothetical protein
MIAAAQDYCPTHGKRFICTSCSFPPESEQVKQARLDLWAEQNRYEKLKREVDDLMKVNGFLNDQLRVK